MPDFYITSEPTSTPVSVEEFRNHVYLFNDTSQDTMLEEILLASQKYVSNYVGEYVTSTGIQWTLDTLNDRQVIPHYQLVSGITSIQYYDSDNELVTVDADDYFIERKGREQHLVYTGENLTTYSRRKYPVLINYNAGYANALAVPLDIRNAILLLATELYDHRGNTTTDNIRLVHLTAERLLSNYRRY